MKHNSRQGVGLPAWNTSSCGTWCASRASFATLALHLLLSRSQLCPVLWHQSLGTVFSSACGCKPLHYYSIFTTVCSKKHHSSSCLGRGGLERERTPCLVQRAHALSHTGGKAKNIHLHITASIYVTVESLHSYVSQGQLLHSWASVPSPAYHSNYFIGL